MSYSQYRQRHGSTDFVPGLGEVKLRRPEKDDPGKTLQLVERILSCRRMNQVASSVLGPISNELGASGAVFVNWTRAPHGLEIQRAATHVADAEGLSSYAGRYHQLDPISEAVLATMNGNGIERVINLAQMIQWSSFRKTEYYNDFLRRLGIEHVLALLVPINAFGRQVMCLGFHRGADMEPFSRHDADRLSLVQSAVAAALARISLQDATRCAESAIDTAANVEHPVGLAIFDAEFRLICGNEKGLEDLGYGAPMQFQLWQDAFKAAGNRLTPGNPGPVKVSDQDKALTATLQRYATPEGDTRYVAATLAANGRSHLMAQARQLRFSEREIEIARLVAGGRSNEAVAHELQISVRTVENHLRATYQKADVNSRTQLVARLLGDV